MDSTASTPWFGEWVSDQRDRVYGWTQDVCAARVREYYAARPGTTDQDIKGTRFTRSSWSKIETNRTFRRVRETTVLHVSIGLMLPLSTCMAMAGYRTVTGTADDHSHRLGRAIRACREHRGLAPHDVANMLGVSATRYQQWENGASVPDALQIHRIAAYLCVSLPDLFAGACQVEAPAMVREELRTEEIRQVRQLLQGAFGSQAVMGQSALLSQA